MDLSRTVTYKLPVGWLPPPPHAAKVASESAAPRIATPGTKRWPALARSPVTRLFIMALMVLPLAVQRPATADSAVWWFVDATDAAGLHSAHGYDLMNATEPQEASGGVAAGDF